MQTKLTPIILEFVTVGVAYCNLLESDESIQKTKFIETCCHILPLLYIKTSLISLQESEEEDISEKFVTEYQYEYIREKMATVFGEDDAYLTLSENVEQAYAVYLSEDLADIYQDVKDCVMNIKENNTLAIDSALETCINNFKEYWGEKLVNALKHLHKLRYNDIDETIESISTTKKAKKKSFGDFLRNDDEIDFSNLI